MRRLPFSTPPRFFMLSLYDTLVALHGTRNGLGVGDGARLSVSAVLRPQEERTVHIVVAHHRLLYSVAIERLVLMESTSGAKIWKELFFYLRCGRNLIFYTLNFQW